MLDPVEQMAYGAVTELVTAKYYKYMLNYISAITIELFGYV